MARYLNNQIRRLKEGLRYESREAARRQVARIKELLPSVSCGAVYPYEYVVERVTGFRPQTSTSLELRGETLIPDLLRLLYDISGRAELRADEGTATVLRLDEVCGRYSVSARTVARWREDGLIAMKFVWPDGSRRTGFEMDLLNDYVRRHAEDVERSSRFSRIGEEERGAIIERARHYARELGFGPSRTIRCVSDEFGRSREAVRYSLWQHDREHHSNAVFDSWREPLTGKQVALIEAALAEGSSIADLARRFNRTSSAIYQVLRLARARRLLSRRIEFVPHPLFEAPDADQDILGLGVVHEPSPHKAAIPPDVKDDAAQRGAIYGPQPLSRDEERRLFLQYNYVMCKAARLQAQLVVGYAGQRAMGQMERLLHGAACMRDRLARSYLRLVASVARRHAGGQIPLPELVSEGNLCLLRAIVKFDVARGNRFSTYLTWALMKTFARAVPEARLFAAGFVTGLEGILDNAASRLDETPVSGDSGHEAMIREVNEILAHLTERERDVVTSRFGFGTAKQATYGEIGKRLGISKERARQIQEAALQKLRGQLGTGRTK